MSNNQKWIDTSVTPPNKSRPIVVIDSWNISEDDIDAQEKDNGNVIQPFQTLRIAFYSSHHQMWWCTISNQRVRFRWYIPIPFDLPSELEDFTHQNGDICEI